MKKIRISGMGCISCAGNSVRDALENLFRQPRLPQQPSPALGTRLTIPVFGLTDFSETLNRPRKLMDHAVDEALGDAGLDGCRPELLKNTGICIGTTGGCQFNDLSFYEKIRSDSVDDLTLLKNYLENSPAEYLKKRLRTGGPAITVSNACASGADAVVIGARWIASGRCDRVIVCGVDELHKVSLTGFYSLGLTSAAPCRPFDRDRSGLNLGEGAGAVILENTETGTERGKKSKLLLSGYASAGDAYHITAPHPQGDGLERAIRRAMETAGLTPQEIGLINAHGTGTAANDPVEASVLCRIFGKGVRYHSTKTYTGHTLGAAGTLELIFAAAMLRSGIGAPSVRFENLPPEIPFPPVLEKFEIRERAVLSTSLAFGGCNAALIAERTE